MDFNIWLTFTIASSIISMIPGPSVFTVISQSISFGLKAAVFCIIGDVIGGIIVMSLSYIGVGAIFVASEELFLVVKWLGVFYIGYLGITQIFETRKISKFELSHPDVESNLRRSIRIGFFTGLLNPKAIIFSMAFLSQFIDMDKDPLIQLLILMITSVTSISIILCLYALLAYRIKNKFSSVKNIKRMNFTSGGILCFSSILMIFVR